MIFPKLLSLLFSAFLFLAITKSASAQGSIQKVIIKSNDGMRFDLDEIKVQSGATIELTLVHTGKRTKEEIISFTKVIAGGESTTITFEAPPKGIYNFLCSVPGHFGLMKGKFIVE